MEAASMQEEASMEAEVTDEYRVRATIKSNEGA